MTRAIALLLASLLLVTAAPPAWADEAPQTAGAPVAGAAPLSPPLPPAPRAVLAGSEGACCPAPDLCRRSRLEIQGHLALLTPDPSGLVTLDSGRDDQIRWDSVDYEPEIGVRVAWTFPWSCWDATLAGTYWGSWEDDQTEFGTLAFTGFPGGPQSIGGVFFVPLHEESTLWDVNLTFTKAWHCSPCFTSRWGFGARYFNFEEEASYSFLTGGNPGPVLTGTFASDIDSELFAAEAVVEGVWTLSDSWDVVARGSVFAGWMHREGEMSSVNVTPPITGTTSENDDLGFGAEVEAALRWHPSPCWSVSVGYGLLILANVTRAHESFDLSNFDTLDIGPVFSDDTLLVHRVFLGVAFDF